MNKFKRLFAVLLWCYSFCLFSICDYCFKNDDTVNYKKCGICLNVSYCSKSCQVSHWKSHKPLCRAKKEQSPPPYSWAIVEEIKDAREIFFHGHKQYAQDILRSIIEREQDKRIQADCLYNIVFCELYHSAREEDLNIELLNQLQFAANFGNESAKAVLNLINYTNSEIEFYDPDIKAELEKYVDDPDWGALIKGRLAYEYYIDSNKSLSSQIFDELANCDKPAHRILGSVGNLKHTLKYYNDRTIINLAIVIAKENYSIYSDKLLVPPYLRFDFAKMLHEYDPKANQDLVQNILAGLIQEEYRPAMYFLEDQAPKAAKKKAKKKPKAKNNQLKEPEALLAGLTEIKAEAALVEVERSRPESPRSDTPLFMASSETKVVMPQPAKTRSTAVSVEQAARAEDPFVTQLKPHVSLRPEAIKDIEKLIKKQGSNLSVKPQDIIDVAKTICESKGGCSANFVAKIRGTKNYWRSKLGRNYRMDWCYIKEGEQLKIEIRHIGLKKNFTYDF